MERAAPTTTNGNGAKSSKNHSRTNSANQQYYESERLDLSRYGGLFDSVERDINSYGNKKPRLDNDQGTRQQQQPYGSSYASHDHQAPWGAAAVDRPSYPVEFGVSHRHTSTAPRPTESRPPRFPVPILQSSADSFNPLSDALPPTWGPQSRQATFPSPPLLSPLVGSPYSRMESSHSAGAVCIPSPGNSSNDSSRDDSRSQQQTVLHQNRSTMSRLYADKDQVYSYYDTGSLGGMPPFSAAQHQSSTDAYAYGRPANSSYQYASSPHTAHEPQHVPQAPVPVPLAGIESREQYFSGPTANAWRHTRQSNYTGSRQSQSTHGDYSVSHTSDGWITYPSNRATTAASHQAATFVNSASSTPGPAAPLKSILHPVDQTPVLRPAVIPRHLGNEIHIAPDNIPPSPEPPSPPRSPTPSEYSIVTKDGKTERRQRSSFTQEQRSETSQTRSIGACLRCKSQRVRCIPSPLGPFNMCVTCEQVTHNSKKVLHEIRCVRWRLVAMTLYRTGGLNLTSRWEGTDIEDVGDWVDDDIREIEIKLFYTSHMHRYDLCDVPVKLRVRRFAPLPDDVLTRKWTKRIVNEDGVPRLEKRYIQLPAYALASGREAIDTLQEYFENNAVKAMQDATKHCLPVIRQHFAAAIQHYQSLPKGDVEEVFLGKFFRLWFYTRFTTGSSYISGDEKLGCAPVDDPDYPLGDRISVPRMITAQCDSIMVTRFLRPLSQEIIPELEKIFRTGNPDNWFTLYVCTFILLEGVSFSCQDRRRHAKENWITDVRYTVSEFVGDLQFGANIILCYWHYYRTMDPLDEGWDIFCQIIEPQDRPRIQIESAKGKGKKKVHVTRRQCDLITLYWHDMVEIANMLNTTPYSKYYEHPLYFVCQMYMRGWIIRETYQHKKPIDDKKDRKTKKSRKDKKDKRQLLIEAR